VTNSSQDTGRTNRIGLMTATIHGGRPADYRVTVDAAGASAGQGPGV